MFSTRKCQQLALVCVQVSHMPAGPAKKRKVAAGKAAKAAVDAAMAAADPEQAAANKAAEKAAKAAARKAKAAAKGKGKKAADSASGNSNVWGPFESPSDEEIDPEALVKSKVCHIKHYLAQPIMMSCIQVSEPFFP